MNGKFRKQSMVVLLKNDFSVRNMFCAIFLPLSAAKNFEKPLRSTPFLVKFKTGLEACTVSKNALHYRYSLKKILHAIENVTVIKNAIFITVTLYLIFRTDTFQNSCFWLLIEKPIKFISKH